MRYINLCFTYLLTYLLSRHMVKSTHAIVFPDGQFVSIRRIVSLFVFLSELFITQHSSVSDSLPQLFQII